MNKIWAWIKLVFDCPKGVICSRCLRLNFFFDDVGVYPRDREAMCRECHPTRPYRSFYGTHQGAVRCRLVVIFVTASSHDYCFR